jgi:hypothetical protein
MSRKVRDAIDAAARRHAKRATLSVGRHELCDYVAEVTSEFVHLASSRDLRFLAYLLAMVFEEATYQSRAASASPLASTNDGKDRSPVGRS